MAQIAQSIPSLINGVSQQTPGLRRKSQLEIQENCVASLVDGLSKRPPTEHVAKLSATAYGNVFVHTINRDATERYLVFVDDGDIDVFALADGTAQTVTNIASTTYLSSTNPRDEFEVVTVKDYSFILNKTIAPATTGTVSGSIAHTVQTFGDLGDIVSPSNDDIAKIIGSESNEFSVYYVQYDSTLDVWEEVAAPGVAESLDATTMPHQLVRVSAGNFEFQECTYLDRTAGDDDTNPAPSFIGTGINDVFFHKNRLGLIAGESYAFSKNGGFFNFWRDTVIALPDTVRIDGNSTEGGVSDLKHAIPFSDSIVLFADQAQFLLSTENSLKSTTITSSLATRFETTNKAKPTVAGSNLYFAVERGEYTGIREYIVDEEDVKEDASNITKHVPRYLPKNVFKMSASTNDDEFLFCLSTEEPNVIYAYQWYVGLDANGNSQKLQSAWGKWTFSSGESILHVDTIGNYVYFVIERADGVYLEKMNLDIKAFDTGLPYNVRLDRKTEVTGVYDSGTNTTTWTMPYEDAGDIAIVRGPAFTGLGLEIGGTTRPSDSTIAATGDWSAGDVILGKNYNQHIRLSQQVLRVADGGTEVAIQDSSLVINTFFLDYSDTGYFVSTVTDKRTGDQQSQQTFNGRIIGSPNNVIGEAPLDSGSESFDVNYNAGDVNIDITNDKFVPASFVSAHWEGTYQP